MEPSKERINRAGDVLRQFWVGKRMADAEVEEALELVGSYRQAHAYPLTLVTMGLRQSAERESENVAVGQRLKRMDRILQKLVRFPRMSPTEVNAVADRIRGNWQVARERDHRDNPETTGGSEPGRPGPRSAPASEGQMQSARLLLSPTRAC